MENEWEETQRSFVIKHGCPSWTVGAHNANKPVTIENDRMFNLLIREFDKWKHRVIDETLPPLHQREAFLTPPHHMIHYPACPHEQSFNMSPHSWSIRAGRLYVSGDNWSHLERGTSPEWLPPSDGQWACLRGIFLNWWLLWEVPASPGLEALCCIGKQAEKAIGSKPGSLFPRGLCLSSHRQVPASTLSRMC